jgi:hypothetical protein
MKRIDFPKVEAALNSFPWTAAAFERDGEWEPAFDAMGLLLRYAGVAQSEIRQLNMATIWRRFGGLLQQEYGLPDETAYYVIQCANDSGHSTQAEAVSCVLTALRGNLAVINPTWYPFLHNLLSAQDIPMFSLGGVYDPDE